MRRNTSWRGGMLRLYIFSCALCSPTTSSGLRCLTAGFGVNGSHPGMPGEGGAVGWLSVLVAKPPCSARFPPGHAAATTACVNMDCWSHGCWHPSRTSREEVCIVLPLLHNARHGLVEKIQKKFLLIGSQIPISIPEN